MADKHEIVVCGNLCAWCVMVKHPNIWWDNGKTTHQNQWAKHLKIYTDDQLYQKETFLATILVITLHVGLVSKTGLRLNQD